MARPTPSCFRPTLWLIVAAVLIAASACTRSNASADSPKSAAAQPTQPQPVAAKPAQPSTATTSELAELQQQADAGDAEAMYHLGRLYASGSGVEKDYVEAFDWYKKAAAKGNSEAMYSLGEAYEHGTGVREDVQRAVMWYTNAYQHGNHAAKAALVRLGEGFEDHD